MGVLRSGLPRAVIFDFDGVILESAEIKTEAFLELFADHPEHREAILQHHLDNQGISRFHKFDWIYRELLGRPLEEAERQRLGAAFSEIALRKILECEFVPGALDLLRALRGRRLSFVASGTPEEELRSVVRQRGVEPYFDGVWGSPLKKPEIIARILEEHRLARGEVVLIGDGISDYEAAQECGIPFVARDTSAVAERWRMLDVTRVPDLRDLACDFGDEAACAATV